MLHFMTVAADVNSSALLGGIAGILLFFCCCVLVYAVIVSNVTKWVVGGAMPMGSALYVGGVVAAGLFLIAYIYDLITQPAKGQAVNTYARSGTILPLTLLLTWLMCTIEVRYPDTSVNVGWKRAGVVALVSFVLAIAIVYLLLFVVKETAAVAGKYVD